MNPVDRLDVHVERGVPFLFLPTEVQILFVQIGIPDLIPQMTVFELLDTLIKTLGIRDLVPVPLVTVCRAGFSMDQPVVVSEAVLAEDGQVDAEAEGSSF